MDQKNPICPHCRSLNVLPFEDDESPHTHTMLIIFLSAFLILGFYFLFVVLSTISYTIMVIILVTLSSFFLNRKERRKKIGGQFKEKEFVCLDCSQSFKQQTLSEP